jgi:23S rRNA pseudouridine2605 synthase
MAKYYKSQKNHAENTQSEKKLVKQSSVAETPEHNQIDNGEFEAKPSGEKLQKVMARSGHASRRESERLIAQKRVKIGQRLAQLGDRVDGSEAIFLDDNELFIAWEKPRQRVLIYHKPPGEICSRKDPEHPNTIFDDLPRLKIGRWVSVGRLDINTTGLILLTNDGELANLLMHPSSEIVREYAVRILGDVTDEDVEQLKTGVQLDDGMAHFDKVSYSGGQGANHWYHVTLKEGRNREVRRMWETLGVTVSRLSRVKYGIVELHRSQKVGRWEEMEDKQLRELYESVGLHINKPKTDHRGRIVSPYNQLGKKKKRLVMPDNRRKSQKKGKTRQRK